MDINNLYLLITAGLITFGFNFLQNRVNLKDRNRTALGSLLLEVIDQLQEKASSYWLKEFSDDNTNELLQEKKKLEIEIKNLCKLVAPYCSSFQHLISDSHEAQQKLSLFTTDIYDLVTGDEFESANRSADSKKSSRIVKKCMNIRAYIHKAMYNG